MLVEHLKVDIYMYCIIHEWTRCTANIFFIKEIIDHAFNQLSVWDITWMSAD